MFPKLPLEAWGAVVLFLVLFCLLPIVNILNNKAKQRRIGKGYTNRLKHRNEPLGRRKP
jgi:hypothetical protein